MKTGYLTLRREMEEMLRPTGLTHAQWSALSIIRHFPGITPSQLEPILMIERPSVTSLINGMTDKGYIVRKDNPHDGRSKQLYLTEAGQDLAEKTQHYASLIEERVKSGMTEEEFEMLRKLLIKMVGIFERRQ
jgi:DNA-binding MarR family transcriptional regulator